MRQNSSYTPVFGGHARLLTSCWNGTFASNEWLGFDSARGTDCVGLAAGVGIRVGGVAACSAARRACCSLSFRSGDGHDDAVGQGRARPMPSMTPAKKLSSGEHLATQCYSELDSNCRGADHALCSRRGQSGGHAWGLVGYFAATLMSERGTHSQTSSPLGVGSEAPRRAKVPASRAPVPCLAPSLLPCSSRRARPVIDGLIALRGTGKAGCTTSACQDCRTR